MYTQTRMASSSSSGRQGAGASESRDRVAPPKHRAPPTTRTGSSDARSQKYCRTCVCVKGGDCDQAEIEARSSRWRRAAASAVAPSRRTRLLQTHPLAGRRGRDRVSLSIGLHVERAPLELVKRAARGSAACCVRPVLQVFLRRLLRVSRRGGSAACAVARTSKARATKRRAGGLLCARTRLERAQ